MKLWIHTATRQGFSLVELLVVIAILSVLITILIPASRVIFEEAEAVTCQSQLRQIGTGMFAFAGEHGFLPAAIWIESPDHRHTGPEPWQKAYIASEVVPKGLDPGRGRQWYWKPRIGVLNEYTGGPDIYRCPSLEDGKLGSGTGSNRMHDYSMICALPGAKVSSLPMKARIWTPKANAEVEVPAPILLEEDPAYHCNAPYIDPHHVSINRLGTWHRKKSGMYLATDASAFRLYYGQSPGPQAYAWKVTRRGRDFSMGDGWAYAEWHKEDDGNRF